MKRIIKLCLVFALSLSIFSSFFTASAQSYNSFTRKNLADGTTENVYTRESYVAQKIIKASDFDLEDEFSEISDLFYADNKLIYMLCSGSSQIIVFNNDLSLNKVMNIVDSNGEVVEFKQAQGIYVKDENIYICDTQNAQILVADLNGNLHSVMEKPESEIIPDNFIYQPTKISIDKDGYTYILSMGCYYGALVYSPDGTFNGFYGANNVQATALDTLSYLWDLITGNDTKRAATQKTLPYAFVDFCFDTDGYMLTCTGTTSGGYSVGQINKMSPSGSNILYKSDIDGTFGTSSNVNFVENEVIKRNNAVRLQNIVAIDTDSDNYIYALESTYGLIYVYDRQCNLISAFGGGIGLGERLGNFKNATALAVCDSKILVADSKEAAVTVFEMSEYGSLLKNAQNLYLSGDYEEAEELWNKVIELDSSCQLAYKGLAIANYKKGNIDKALEYAKIGLDYNTYDLAFQAKLKENISKNFFWIFPVILVAIVALIVGIVYKNKKQIVLITNPKVSTLASSVMHPFRAFQDIKQKNLGSMLIAVILVLLFYVSTTFKTVASSFLFRNIADGNYNTFFTIAQTIGLVVLWSLANWLISSLFSGKGTFKEVFISTAYCLVPIIIYNFITTVLSYVLPLTGKEILDGIYIVIVIYTAYLLCAALTTMHDYSLSKLVAVSIVTVLAMLLVVFVIFMVVILLQQFGDFVYSIFVEAVYR